ncbi:hypothetical protein HYO05_21815 [Vibrio parahaemolyticus]|uniref:DUF7940 domain-containing protein n=1 Tax=Vibrio TaxID=662 RepID=UPI00193D950E|nr:hypothetical protein [Vibrio sp. Isolate23]MBM5036744.1 hypothetical protein [Vibrio parahaemolyticus]HAS6087815.1 hypothetical protein [Vibrio vulnificus]MBM5050423.1 hypothetical protein [Vibrio parahaemolyticus]MBM5077869.1 hypothetical protein [Vibrio parahaemolyticus]MCG9685152.1 hypothetical protein [Vibrio sp. Isolate23]
MLINNWKQAYKLWSVQCALAIALVNVLLAVLPSLQDYMTVTVYAVLNAVLAGGIAVLRVLSQVPVDQLKAKHGQ